MDTNSFREPALHDILLMVLDICALNLLLVCVNGESSCSHAGAYAKFLEERVRHLFLEIGER